MGSDASKCVLTPDDARGRLGHERLCHIENLYQQLAGIGNSKGLQLEPFRSHFLQCAFPGIPINAARRLMSLLDVKGKGGLSLDETVIAVALIYASTDEERLRFSSLLALPPAVQGNGQSLPAPTPEGVWLQFLRSACNLVHYPHGMQTRVRGGTVGVLPTPQIHAIERGVADHCGMSRRLFDNIVDAHNLWRGKNNEASNVVDSRLVKRTTCSGAGGVMQALLGSAVAPTPLLLAPAAPARTEENGGPQACDVTTPQVGDAAAAAAAPHLALFSTAAPVPQPLNNYRSCFNLLFHAFYTVLLHAHSSGVVTLLDLVSAIGVWRYGTAADHAQYTLRIFRQYWVTSVELYGLMDAKFDPTDAGVDTSAREERQQALFTRMLLFFMLRPNAVYMALSLMPSSFETSGAELFYDTAASASEGEQAKPDGRRRRLCNYNTFVDLNLGPQLEGAVSQEMLAFARDELLRPVQSAAEGVPVPAEAALVNAFNPTAAEWCGFWKRFLQQFPQEGGEGLHKGLLTAVWHTAMVEVQIKPETREEEVEILQGLQGVEPWQDAFSYFLVDAAWWGRAIDPNTQHLPQSEKLNEGLLAPGGLRLREDAVEGKDYVVVTRGAWKAITGWYRVGPPIMRRQVEEPAGGGCTVEAHPFNVKCVLGTPPALAASASAASLDTKGSERTLDNTTTNGNATTISTPAPPAAAAAPPMDPQEYIMRNENFERYNDPPPARPPQSPLVVSGDASPHASSGRSPLGATLSAPSPLLSDCCVRETMCGLPLQAGCTVGEMVERYLELLLAPTYPHAMRPQRGVEAALERVRRALRTVESDGCEAGTTTTTTTTTTLPQGIRAYHVSRRYAEVLMGDTVASIDGVAEGELFLLQLPEEEKPSGCEGLPADAPAGDAGPSQGAPPPLGDEASAAAAAAATPPVMQGGGVGGLQHTRYGSKVEARYYTLKDNSHYIAYARDGVLASSPSSVASRGGGGGSGVYFPDGSGCGGMGPVHVDAVSPNLNQSIQPARGVVREVIPAASRQRKGDGGAEEESPDDILYIGLVGKDHRRWVRRAWITAVLPEGRTWDDSHGRVGLCNLGNTCYMNAALQCLSHTALLRDYFLHHTYYAWDVSAKTTWEGMNGQLAISFAELLEWLWCTPDTTHPRALLSPADPLQAQVPPGPISPKRFRDVVATFNPEYALNRQQDAHEFLAVLLNALKMDLAKECTTGYKEYQDAEGRSDADVADERWEDYVMRQNSIITNVFTAQFKTKTSCSGCDRELRNFETLDMLQVPLPELDHAFQTVFVHPRGAAVKMSLKVQREGSVVQTLLNRAEEMTPDILSESMAAPLTPNSRSPPDGTLRFVAVTLNRTDSMVEKYIPAASRLDQLNPNARIHLYSVAYPTPPPAPASPATPATPGEALQARRTESAQSSGSARSASSQGGPAPAAGVPFLEVVHRKRTPIANSEGVVGAKQFQFRMFSVSPTLVAPLQAFADVSREEGVGFSNDGFINRVYEEVWQASRWMAPEYHLFPFPAPGSAQPPPPPASAAPPALSNQTKKSPQKAVFGLNKRYPFFLKLVGQDGMGCTRCRWVSGCTGCVYDPRKHGVLLQKGERLSADWDSSVWDVYGNVKIACSVHPHSSVAQHREEMGRGITTTLPYCLDTYAQDEVMSMKCPRCDEETDHTASIRLWRLPPVFVVHLKRFLFANGGVKISGLVDFPLRDFDLSPWCCKESPHITPRNSKYQLYAVIYHRGTLSSGHYYAHILSGGKWWCCDDTEVSEIPESRVVTPEAYVLLYSRISPEGNTVPDIWETPASYPKNSKDVFAIKTAGWSKSAVPPPARRPQQGNGKGKCVVM